MNNETIVTQCPHCGNRLKAPITSAGKQATCAGCGEAFMVVEKPPQPQVFIGPRKPHEDVSQVIGQTESDLVVMGSAGRRGLGRMLMGGVTRKVARDAPCSMITIRSEHAIRLRLDAEGTDIEAHFKLGHELLALGFPEEAGCEFRRCIAKDNLYAPAWEGLATVHERLGEEEEARRFEEQAEHITQSLYHKHIEADIRSSHPLFRPLFGIK